MNYYLLKSLDGKTTLAIQKDEYLVGRGATCDGVVMHNNLSRRHALFRVTPEGVTVQDLGSTNGTLVNNQRITRETLIRSGDVITLGTVSFSLMASQNPNETVLMQNLSGALKEADSSFVEEMLSIGGETILREKFPMPPGWMSYGEELSTASSTNHTHSREVDALLARRLEDPNASAALVVVSGNEKSRVVSLAVTADKHRWIIGRSDEAQIQFGDAGVSRYHAELSYEFGAWRIENKDSKNAVLINGARVQSSSLKHQDELNLGGVLMVFCLIDKKA